MAVPRTTHQWLRPLYDFIDDLEALVYPSGQTGIPQAQVYGIAPVTRLGNATGVIGLYGASGIAQVPTGGAGILSATFLGASGFGATLIAASGVALSASGVAIFLSRFADNGGTGTPYTFGDVVTELKNLGILKP